MFSSQLKPETVFPLFSWQPRHAANPLQKSLNRNDYIPFYSSEHEG